MLDMPLVQNSKNNVNTTKININVPEEVSFISVIECDKAENYLIEPNAHAFKPRERISSNQEEFFNRSFNTQCIAMYLGRDRRIIIPVYEIIRFYWGSSSSSFYRTLLEGKIESLREKGDLSIFLDPSLTGIDENKTFHIALRAQLHSKDAYALGRLWCDPVARLQATNMIAGLRLPQPQSFGLATRTSFPFVGITQLKVEGVVSHHKDGSRTMLVYRIRSCSHSLPYDGIRLASIRPPRLSQNEEKAKILDQKKEIGKKLKLLRYRRYKPSRKTTLSPPNKKMPIMYQYERFADMFPDALGKPIQFSERSNGKNSEIRPEKTKEEAIGGFGQGESYGDVSPVVIFPASGSRPHEELDAVKERRSAMQTILTLNNAARILEDGRHSFSTEVRCAEVADIGCFYLSDPENIDPSSDMWEHVFDDSIKALRPRLGKIIEFKRRLPNDTAKSVYVESAPAYGYAMEIESSDSTFAYFEKFDMSRAADEELRMIIDGCIGNSGKWRVAVSQPVIDGKGNEISKKRFYLSFEVDGFRVRIEQHWWRDDAKKLADKIEQWHSSYWIGLMWTRAIDQAQ